VLRFTLASAAILLIGLVIPRFDSAARRACEWFWFPLIGPILCALFHRRHREILPTYNGGYTRCQKCGLLRD
jgi:hypothetical protein